MKMLLTKEVWKYLLGLLNRTDLVSEYGIVFEEPQTEYILAEYIGTDVKTLSGLMNSLIYKNVLSWTICCPNGYAIRVYQLNPSAVGIPLRESDKIFFKQL